MALHYAHEYFCTAEGIFVRYHSLAWRRGQWRPTVWEEMSCYCRWPAIVRVEGVKKPVSGGRMSDETSYLWLYTEDRVLKAKDDDDGLTRFAHLRDGLLAYLPGFPLDWQLQLDSHLCQQASSQQQVPLVLYQRARLMEEKSQSNS